VAGSTGAMVKDADFWVKAIKKELIACLIDGVCVKLEDLGTFEPRQRAERKHPHNAILGGKDSVFKSKTVAHLKPSRRLNTVLTMAYESRRGELDNE